ncbi:MAG: Gfo/Idh/MocA family oxidoreductase [Planctomycetaceae bacterium]|nr:Gfo/Idh/MocA family oxidoreductase [Planctomycetaceae bacterium]
MQRLRVGIVGAGRLGSFHADKAASHAGVELAGLYDANAGQAKTVADKHGVRRFDSLESLAAEVQAAVIAVPSVLHFGLAQKLLERKIHLLIEKPMTTASDDAKRLLESAEKNHLIIAVGHTEQFNPAWSTAVPLFPGSEPCYIETRRTSGYTFRSTDIGVVLDLMIHDLDLVLSVVPATVEKIEVFGFATLGGFEDFAQTRLTFANGTVANLLASRIEPEAVRQMKVSAKHKSLFIDFAKRTTTQIVTTPEVQNGVFSPENMTAPQIPQVQPTFMSTHFHKQEWEHPAVDALSLEMADFVEAVRQNRPPQVSGHRAAKAVDLAEKILAKIYEK